MPKNTIIPAAGGPGPAPPVPEQSIRFDRGRATNLRGYSPSSTENSRWVMSWWQKVTGDLSLGRVMWEARVDANNFTRFEFLAGGAFRFQGVVGGIQEAYVETKRVMIDVTNWHHCHFRFDAPGGFIQFSINGYGYPGIQLVPFPTINNVAGYVWMASGVEHVIGSDDANTAGSSAYFAEMHCVPAVILEPTTSFGVFNSKGVWERIVYAGLHGISGFYLPFSRTIDLGEDFSGLGNDFTVHTNAAPAGGDQADDWMERNYCTLDVNDPRTTGTIDEGGLDVAGGNAAVTMRPHFGVWYYEVNGVATVWDTGVSGDFDPIIAGPAAVNFGQFPFVDVGPMGLEMTVNSNNFPITSTDISRDFMAAISYSGDAAPVRVVTSGDGQSTIYDIEYKDILFRCDLALIKNAGPGEHWYFASRLRNGNSITLSSTAAEQVTNLNGYISDLPDPGPGVEMTKGGTDGVNVNEFGPPGNVYGLLALHVKAYGINILTLGGTDTAEEVTIDAGAVGDTDTTSSDLEMVEEGGTPVQEVGVRFQNVPIPQGSQIVEARIQFTTNDTNAGADDMLMFCEDIDDAPVFVDGSNNFNITNRTKTSPGVAWSPAAWNVLQERAPAQLTSSFAPELQQVIDRLGWASGNSLVWIVAEDPGGTRGEREAEANPPDLVPELQVRFRSPGVEADSLVSLFTYEGIGVARDVMHGNNNIPELIALKNLGGNDWVVYCSAIQTAGNPEDGRMSFNNTSAFTASTDWDNTPPGGTFFRVGTPNRVNEAGIEFSGFSVASLPGFSKVFRYVGNGSLDGPEVYLGFKPRWIVFKRTQVAENWLNFYKATDIIAAENNQFNPSNHFGFLNTTDNFYQAPPLPAFPVIECYSSGFKITALESVINAAGAEYVGFAFAEAPFQHAKAPN